MNEVEYRDSFYLWVVGVVFVILHTITRYYDMKGGDLNVFRSDKHDDPHRSINVFRVRRANSRRRRRYRRCGQGR